jgi:predicted metal-dependent phosphoesterase TrpH
MTGSRATVRFDPHVHTEASYDADGSPEAVLEAAESAGLDALAITDHDTTAGAERATAVADEYDVLVVPGVELSTEAGHLLGLGVTTRPPVGTAFADAVRWVRRRGGLAVVPHPFQVSRHGVRERDLSDCDGVESFNPWAVTGIQNARATAFAERHDYPRLGGSDAHRPATVGTAYTDVTVEAPVRSEEGVSVDGLLTAIEAGRTEPGGSRTSLGAYLGKYTGSLRRHTVGRLSAPLRRERT